MADDNRGWHGDSQGHAQAGSQRGTGSQRSGKQNTAQNLSDEDRSKGGKASHQKGVAHEFDSEEAREAGRKGGSR